MATPIEVTTQEEFEREVLQAAAPTVVLFWSSWCPFCRTLRPLFDRLPARYDTRFVVVLLEEDANPLWNAYQVEVVPSLAYFQSGEIRARKDGRLGRGLSEHELSDFVRMVERMPQTGKSLPR